MVIFVCTFVLFIVLNEVEVVDLTYFLINFLLNLNLILILIK